VPDPTWGAYDAPVDPLVGWRGGHPVHGAIPLDAFGISISVPRFLAPLRKMEGKGREGEGRDECPQLDNLDPPVRDRREGKAVAILGWGQGAQDSHILPRPPKFPRATTGGKGKKGSLGWEVQAVLLSTLGTGQQGRLHTVICSGGSRKKYFGGLAAHYLGGKNG